MSPVSQQQPLAVYYHTHWDREWYLPFRAYQLRLAAVVDEVLERLETGAIPCFMLDGQTVVLDDYLELRPQNRERLAQLIASGRLRIGPWYVMPDELLVSGEGLIRNLRYGLRDSMAWGCREFTGYLPDTFGHSGDIPTILRQCGISSTVVWRGIHPKKSVFQWQSPSGASVLALHLTDGYFQMMLHDWTATEAEKQSALEGLVEKLEAGAISEAPGLIPIGGDHLAPVSVAGLALLRTRYPNLTETTPEQYLAGVAQRLNGTALPTVMGELTDNMGSFLLPGVYSSRMYLKQANRQAEHALEHRLEPLLAMAQTLLPSALPAYPQAEMDVAWKTLLLNHPHDSICGCSVDAVHRENEVRFDHVTQLSEALIHQTAYQLGSSAAALQKSTHGQACPWVVFNTGGRTYTGVVPVTEDVPDAQAPSSLVQMESEETVLQDGYRVDAHQIPLSHLTQIRRNGWIWAENIPAFGMRLISPEQAAEIPAGAAVQVSSNRLENSVLSVALNPDGSLTVTERATGRKYGPLLYFQDALDQGDSYNSAPVPGSPVLRAELIQSCITLPGPLVAGWELTHQLPERNLTLMTQIRLEASSSVLTFETRFVNQSSDHKLQVCFETGAPVCEVQAESHLGVVSRTYDPNYREADFMPVERMKELKTNTGPVQRFFSVNGHSWITQGLTEYEVYRETVAITLMRAFGALSSATTGVRGAQAGPPFATPEGQCLGREFVCQYAWTLTPPDVHELYTQAGRFYGDVWGQMSEKAQVSTGSKEQNGLATSGISLLSWEDPALVASACYWLPGRGLALRLVNTTDQPVNTPVQTGFNYQRIQPVNFLEMPVGGPLAAPVLTLPPLGVNTWLFEV